MAAVGSDEPSKELPPEQVAAGQRCRDVLLRGTTVKAGVLQKMGGSSLGIGAFKSWKERWVVVDGPYLKYYLAPPGSDAGLEKPRGVLELDGAALSKIAHPKSDSPYVFQVATVSGRKEPFLAHDEQDFMSWMDTINGVITVLAQFPGPGGSGGSGRRGSVAAGAGAGGGVPVRSGPAVATPTSPAGSTATATDGRPPPGDVARRASMPPSMSVGSPVTRGRAASFAPAGSDGVDTSQPVPQLAPAPTGGGGTAAAVPLPPPPGYASPAVGAPPPPHAAVASAPGVGSPYGAPPAVSPAHTTPDGGAVAPAWMPPPPGSVAAGSVVADNKCSRCQVDNEAEALFCENCGNRLK